MHRTPRILLATLGFVVAMLLLSAPAFAGQADPYTQDTGGTETDEGQGNQVLGNTATRSTGTAGTGALALTGAETITLALVGGGLVIGGAAFVMAGRRKDSSIA